MTTLDRPSTLIIGAGIVGIASAVHLAEAGHAVTVVDRTGICEETSSGNAAALAFSDVLPLAQKGMIRNVPKWLADPLGPLAIRPAYLPRLAPWLWRFWRAGWSANHETSLAAQAGLMQLAEREWLALFDRTGLRHMLREDGSLELYEGQREFDVAGPGWAARERFGIAFRHVASAELADLQPGLSRQFTHGTFVPGWKTVSDPKLLGKALWEHAARLGAGFVQGTIAAIEACARPAVRLSDGRRLEADRLVVAAGAWSHRLAAGLGETIPLETERGYNTTLPADAFDVRRQLIFSGHGFVVTPLETGLRIGGAVEFAGLEAAANFARARAMLAKTEKFLPGLRTRGGREWMGYRPSLPDSLPVISPAKHHQKIVYAFGHGHLGLTQAAATGRLVRALVSGENPAIDLSPFRSTRF